MLYRKIESKIKKHLQSDSDKVLVVTGARQIGKSYIIRHVGKKLFPNYFEINLAEDAVTNRAFANVNGVEEFHLALSAMVGNKLGSKQNTLIFLDEIQEYPRLLTLLKFLRQEGKYTYIASGSLLGVTLRSTTSIPIGSISMLKMYPLDFEEFLIANGFGAEAFAHVRQSFENLSSVSEGVHNQLMALFKRYLLVGGMPDAVNEFLKSRNLVNIRKIQTDIRNLYAIDASKYDEEHRLKIQRIYNLIASNMENKKKRLVYKDVENKPGKRASDYADEVEYLVGSGTTLEVKAISNPKFPLIESGHKNLLKLYMNDVGLLSDILYSTNITPIMDDNCSVNLGSVYECVAATELAAHGNHLFYYDNRKYGEVDYLIDDYNTLSVVPLEIKSGKDYRIHSALTRFVSTPDYHIERGYVLSNTREVTREGDIIYMPIYMVMFFSKAIDGQTEILI